MRTLVASLTIALLAALLAGCIGADGESSMMDLYGAAQARAGQWNENAVLVHAGSMEIADAEKWFGDDEEADDEQAAEDAAVEEDVDADETDSDEPPFELRNDPDVGNGRGVFWMFMFADPESGSTIGIAVETNGEKVHVLDQHEDADDAWEEAFQGFGGLAWNLDSDTAASKAHANEEFHEASRRIQDPVYFVGLTINDAEFGEEEGYTDPDEDPANDTADEEMRGIWVITGMGMVKSDHADEPKDDGDSHGGMEMNEGWTGWAVAYAVIDAVDGRVLEAGVYDAEDWDDDFGYGFGWGDEDYGEMPEDFTAFQNSYGGRLTRAQPEARNTVPVEMEGLEMRVTFCFGRSLTMGSATFEVVDPNGDVVHEFEADEGPLAVGRSGTDDWSMPDLVAGDYEVNVRLNGGLASDWGMDVWVGTGEPMEIQVQGPGPFAPNAGAC